jgi:hypothetical protein|tara:strand:- start:2597 stop:3265 length:669 start_codon:yes stop_codon:yes gene_type:complete
VAVRGIRSVSTKVGGTTQKFGQSEIHITDYRDLITALKGLEGEVLKEFFKGAKEIAKPVQDGIKKSIPLRAPLSRMRPAAGGIPGRLTWGTGKPARSATIVAGRPKASFKGKRVAIVKVVVKSPATIMADMAGKSRAYVNKKAMTEEYAYTRTLKGKFGSVRRLRTVRRHKINGQGNAMIDKLGSQPSRYVYPGAEAAFGSSVREFDKYLGDAIIMVERETR